MAKIDAKVRQTFSTKVALSLKTERAISNIPHATDTRIVALSGMASKELVLPNLAVIRRASRTKYGSKIPTVNSTFDAAGILSDGASSTDGGELGARKGF